MKFVRVFSILLCFSALSIAQVVGVSKSQEFANQIIALDRNGETDKAIALAEKALKFEKDITPKSQLNLANAYLNVAILTKKRVQINQKKFEDKNLKRKLQNEIYLQLKDDSKASEHAFRKAIEIYEGQKIESLTLATAKYELVDVIRARMNELGFLFFEATAKDIYEKLDEIAELYESSYLMRLRLSGIENEVTLKNAFVLAEFQQKRANFEAALSLYRQFILGAEKMYADESKILIPVLRKLAEIYVAIDDQENLDITITRIFSISKVEEPAPTADYILNERLISPDPRSPLMTKEYRKTPIGGAMSISAVSVSVAVLVDENGDVISAVSGEEDKELRTAAEKDVMKWKFKPFEFNGEKRKLKGVALYKRVIY